MIPAFSGNVVQMPAGQAVGKFFQVLFVIEKTQVILDLGMTGIVPVSQVTGIFQCLKETGKLGVQGEFADSLAVFHT